MTTSWGNEDEIFHYNNVMTEKTTKKRTAKAPAAESSVCKKQTVKQCGLLTRKYEYDELGAPDTQSGCFGCCYIGEQEAGAVPFEEIMNLINLIRKSIAKTDPVNLANYVAKKYAALREEINSNLMPGEKPLPEWKAATILQHLRYHNVDAELQTWNRMVEYQELIKIALDASVVRDEDTGEVKINPVQAKMYIELTKQYESLSKSDPTEKLYYSGGNNMDMKAASEGFISYSGKPLIAMWKSK